MQAELPSNEAARLDALRDYRILDTLPEDCYDDITLLASEICGTPMAAVSLIDSTRQWFKSRVGLTVPETARENAFCAHTILQADINVVNNVLEDERFADNPLVTGDPWIRFYAGAPLVTPEGKALGTLCVIDQIQRTLTDMQINALRALSRQVMAQLELRRYIKLQAKNQRTLNDYQKKLEQMNALFQKQSVTDDVTGFHNTRFLHQYLNQCLGPVSAELEKLTLVFFDMDNFKQVVDRHGHLLGAKVLKEVAEVVHSYLDTGDQIVRYGGDEYIVILPGQGAEKALPKVEAIRKGISSNSYLQHEEIHLRVSASFGMATFPDDARDKKQLLMAADQCLFYSKKGGKNRITTWR
ncbi:sensor domain-containing diguanylate cyclase [Desulfobacula sp.]|uniref:GGDEF domain-containing protein n=1 Tax=Desulfobacula sp. TaxID=2593537 RepID=UPI00262558BA|nr:sensor domain-containing diguanylate cyclase [Desulfobacula sp.]